MRLILFDCDGTLANSFGIICATMQRTFEEAGLPAPEDAATRGIIGLSLDQAIHRLTPTSDAAQVSRLVERYRAAFHVIRTEAAHEEALFPGIEPMLRRLGSREDLLLGIVTGKSRRGVRHIVEAHRLEGLFQAVRTADDCPSKPHPAMVLECCAELGIEPAETIVVGDSVFDMGLAVAAGAAGIGVAWGAASPDSLRDAGAVAIAADAAELERLLTRWVDRADLPPSLLTEA